MATLRVLLASVACGLASACAPAEPPSSLADGTPAGLGCPDDGPRLPLTGICAGRAWAYLTPVEGEAWSLPDGCSWSVKEAAMPGGEVLLYAGADCGAMATELEVAPGARSAEIQYVSSAFYGADARGETVVRMITSDPEDPTANLVAFARLGVEDPAEAAACQARPAGVMGWPADALVVDDRPVASEPDADGPRTACGRYGLDEDSTSFWRVSQGYAWFFDLGQDAHEIDPRTFTIVAPSEDSGWVANN